MEPTGACNTGGGRAFDWPCCPGSQTWKLTFLKASFALLFCLPSGLCLISKGRHWIKEKAAEVERTRISNLLCFILAPENFVCAGTGVGLSESGMPTCVPQEVCDVPPGC